nr:carboxypeptidase-like regulatory domain-containing protein [bacterium]
MRKCEVYFFIFLMILVQGVNAYDVEGIIKDFDGQPLEDAMIRLLDTQRFERGKDFTDKDGTYQIHGIAAGYYTMEITKMGMKKVTEEISVGGPYFDSTVYKDINLSEIVRFEGVKESDLKGLFILDKDSIPRGAFSCYR